MKLKNLAVPSAFLIVGSLLVGACTIGEVDDIGGFGGFGGNGTGSGGKAASGGSDAGTGAGGMGGDGPEQTVICGAGPNLAAVTPASGDDACTTCQKTKCPDEYGACFSTGETEYSRAACSFGTTTFTPKSGAPMDIIGEYLCMDSCIKEEAAGDAQAIADCAAKCGSECATTAGEVTVDFMTCVVIGNGQGDDCYSACYD